MKRISIIKWITITLIVVVAGLFAYRFSAHYSETARPERIAFSKQLFVQLDSVMTKNGYQPSPNIDLNNLSDGPPPGWDFKWYEKKNVDGPMYYHMIQVHSDGRFGSQGYFSGFNENDLAEYKEQFDRVSAELKRYHETIK